MVLITSLLTALVCFVGGVIVLRAELFNTAEVQAVRSKAIDSPFYTLLALGFFMPLGLGVVYVLAVYLHSFMFVLQAVFFGGACGFIAGGLYRPRVGWTAFFVSTVVYLLFPFVIVHNIFGVLAVVFAASALLSVLSPWMVMVLCVGLSLYDIIAVHQLGVMQETVKKAADGHFLPAFLFPTAVSGLFQHVEAYLGNFRGVLLIGFGDYIFATALVASPFHSKAKGRPVVYGTAIALGVLAGLYGSGFATMLPFFDRGVAALPFITTGALAGVGAGWLVNWIVYEL